MVTIVTFNDRPVRHVRYMPDGSVIWKATLHARLRLVNSPAALVEARR